MSQSWISKIVLTQFSLGPLWFFAVWRRQKKKKINENELRKLMQLYNKTTKKKKIKQTFKQTNEKGKTNCELGRGSRMSKQKCFED